jgi:hypothetical protein
MDTAIKKPIGSSGGGLSRGLKSAAVLWYNAGFSAVLITAQNI